MLDIPDVDIEVVLLSMPLKEGEKLIETFKKIYPHDFFVQFFCESFLRQKMIAINFW